MPETQVELARCEFCNKRTGNVELELFNISGKEMLTCMVAVIALS